MEDLPFFQLSGSGQKSTRSGRPKITGSTVFKRIFIALPYSGLYIMQNTMVGGGMVAGEKIKN